MFGEVEVVKPRTYCFTNMSVQVQPTGCGPALTKCKFSSPSQLVIQ